MSGDVPPEHKDDNGTKSGLKLVGIFFSVALLLGSLYFAPWSAPMSVGTGIAWGGIAAQGVGLGMQIAGKAIETKNSGLSDILAVTGFAVSLVGFAMFTGGIFRNAYKAPGRQPAIFDSGDDPVITTGSPPRGPSERSQSSVVSDKEVTGHWQNRRQPGLSDSSAPDNTAGTNNSVPAQTRSTASDNIQTRSQSQTRTKSPAFNVPDSGSSATPKKNHLSNGKWKNPAPPTKPRP